MLVHSFTAAAELRDVLLDPPLFLDQVCTAIAMLRRTYATAAADAPELAAVFAAEAAAEAAAGSAAPLAAPLAAAVRALLARLYGEGDAVDDMATGVAEALLFRAEPDTILALVAEGGAEALAARVDATLTWLAAAASADAPPYEYPAVAAVAAAAEASPLAPLEKLFGTAVALADAPEAAAAADTSPRDEDATPCFPYDDATPELIQRLMDTSAAPEHSSVDSRPAQCAAPPDPPPPAAGEPPLDEADVPPGFGHTRAPISVVLPNGMPASLHLPPPVRRAHAPRHHAAAPKAPSQSSPLDLDAVTGAGFRALKASLTQCSAGKPAAPRHEPPSPEREEWLTRVPTAARDAHTPAHDSSLDAHASTRDGSCDEQPAGRQPRHGRAQVRAEKASLNSEGYPLRPHKRVRRLRLEAVGVADGGDVAAAVQHHRCANHRVLLKCATKKADYSRQSKGTDLNDMRRAKTDAGFPVTGLRARACRIVSSTCRLAGASSA